MTHTNLIGLFRLSSYVLLQLGDGRSLLMFVLWMQNCYEIQKTGVISTVIWLNGGQTVLWELLLLFFMEQKKLWI